VNIADAGDLFAAFDEAGNVHGVAGQKTASFGGLYDGQIYYEMAIWSNDVGELIHFQYYDASEDIVYDISETYEFVINDILGEFGLVEGAMEFNIPPKLFQYNQSINTFSKK
jgi:hypothetical protein